VQQLARSEVIDLIPITMTITEQAAKIAAQHRIRGCHAAYVALADQLSDTLTGQLASATTSAGDAVAGLVAGQ
jgi:predicted nucleic acid-binding protein